MESMMSEVHGLLPPDAPGTAKTGYVMDWVIDPANYCSEHEKSTRRVLAERIAALKGLQYFGPVSRRPPPAGPLYFVPSDTVECHRAHAIGIRSEDDFFGGAVPFNYVATKAISHGLQESGADCPRDWVD